MRALVTGGAGFIGSNLTRALVARGHHVVVADNLCAHHSLRLLDDVMRDVDFHHIDIRCEEDFARLPQVRYERVYHLAASFANELSVQHPALDRSTNSLGTRNTLAFAREHDCELFVYTGSSSSYGDVAVPFREDGELQPSTPYAKSKLEGERHVEGSGLPYAIFRLFNVYGPGDVPGPYRNVVSNMMSTLANDEGYLRITGGDATRDFNYVDDVVDVLLDPRRALGQTVNIGTSVETPVVSLAREILRLFGRPSDHLRIEPPRAWDRVVRRVACVDRLDALYGPRRLTGLSTGLQRTAEWLRSTGVIPSARANLLSA
jgi:UDP-glucose 4-epimerase